MEDLDVVQDFRLLYIGTYVSLKGKTYWFASDNKDEQLDMLLVNFDWHDQVMQRPWKPILEITNNIPLKADSLQIQSQYYV